MKLAYTALVVLTVIVGTRFAREFTAAVRGSRHDSLQAAARVGQHQSVPTSVETTSSAPPEIAPLSTAVVAAEPETFLEKLLPIAEPPAATLQPASVPLQPQRHQGPREKDTILPGDFSYLGAFRPPHVDGLSSSFSYGGAAVAFRTDGDPHGASDGFPGSLYLVGHIYDQHVAEISIPEPVISRSKSADDLNVSRLLQPFGDISGGIQAELSTSESQPYRIGGLHVVDKSLHWTLFRYYNVEGYDFHSHGLSSLDVRQPQPAGPWHLGPFESGAPEWHAYKHAGYICDAPPSVTERLGGRGMLSGLQISTGLQTSSQGPALFAYRLPDSAPAAGASLDALPLLWYSMERPLAGHHPADSWTGAAWLQAGDKQAVVFIGRKATGPVYYGEGRPQDCSDSKGYHGPPYEVQALFYSADELVQAGNRERNAFSLQPQHRWTGHSSGGGLSQYMFPTCDQSVGGLAYDRMNNLLYLVQLEAGITEDSPYEPLPIIHVFRIAA